MENANTNAMTDIDRRFPGAIMCNCKFKFKAKGEREGEH